MFNKRVIFIQHDSPDHCEHLRHRTVRKLVQKGRKAVKTSEPVFDDVSGKWVATIVFGSYFYSYTGQPKERKSRLLKERSYFNGNL